MQEKHIEYLYRIRKSLLVVHGQRNYLFASHGTWKIIICVLTQTNLFIPAHYLCHFQNKYVLSNCEYWSISSNYFSNSSLLLQVDRSVINFRIF